MNELQPGQLLCFALSLTLMLSPIAGLFILEAVMWRTFGPHARITDTWRTIWALYPGAILCGALVLAFGIGTVIGHVFWGSNNEGDDEL
jgi:hypothetical protein